MQSASDNLIEQEPVGSYSDTNAPVLVKAEKILNKKDDKMFEELTEKSYSALDLLRYKSQRNKFIILCIFWFFISSNYYGFSFNLKNIDGNMYLLGIIMNSLDITAYLFGGIIANYAGRKNTILCFLFIAIIIYLLNTVLTLSVDGSNILSFLARFSVSTITNVLYTYTFELYPTVIRSYGFGYNTLIGGIGSFLIPIVIEYFPSYINLIFMVMNICNFTCVLLLPTTLNKPLPDFIPELVIQKEVKANITNNISNDSNDFNINPLEATNNVGNSPLLLSNSPMNIIKMESPRFRKKTYANEV